MIKKILKILGWTLLILIVVAFTAPFIFKNKIIALVKEEINNNVNAKVDFSDVDISFFRSFPRVAVGLENVQVIGADAFAKDTLFSARRLDASMDIMSVIRAKDMNIYSVVAESPRVHAIVSKTGLANWDIMKPADSTAATTETAPFKMQLQRYAINNAYISYVDETSGINTEIINLNHEGTGDFTSDLFTLKTTTNADDVTVLYAGIPYLSHVKAGIKADFDIDNKTDVYTFNTDQISVNDLKLAGKGSIKNLAASGYNMDIQFNAPSTDFKNILSLIPAIYQRDFDKIKTSGSAIFSGFVKGIYNDTQIPAYHVDLKVNNGFFQYPDLPIPLKQINFVMQVDNPDGVTDNTIVNIEKAHFEMDNDPFDFRLRVVKPVTDMYIDAAAKGKLDLSKVAKLVKLEEGTSLKGLLNADVNVKGNVAAIEKQEYEKFNAGGTINLSDFLYVAKDYPTGVKINNLLTSFTPAKVDITNLSGQYLNTNFIGTGQINNLLSYVLNNKPMDAALTISADKINLNDWMGVSTDTTTTGPASAPFVVPGNLNVIVNAKVDQLHYDKVDIKDMSGSLKINDESVVLSNVKGNALDGSIAISGLYSTKASKIKPDVVLSYDVSQVDVQKTFYAFNTVQKLMPIGKFIAGKLTSHLTLNGKLGDNMMPDMSTLTGIGELLLIEGFLSKFAPLDKIANALSVNALQQISMKDVKTYFEFSNGKVLVKPFKLAVGGINMEIGGLQGLDQSLDYVINMKLPRTLMGDKGNQLVNNLVTQVNNKGIPVKVGETINLNLKLGGFFTNPTVKTDLKEGAENLADQLKQQATDFVKAKVDSTRQAVTSAVKDTIASVKQQAIQAAKEEVAKQLLGGKTDGTDSTKTKVDPKESVKGLMNNLFKKKAKDSMKN